MSGKKDKLRRKPVVSDVEKSRLQEVATKLGRSKSLRCALTWPGGNAELELQLLSVNDVREAEAEALSEVQLQVGDNFIPRGEAAEALATSKAKHLMSRACMVPGTEERFFDSAKELGEITTEYELFAVYQRYEEHKQETDPDLNGLTEEQLNVIDEAIKKKAVTSLKSIASDLPKSSLLILVDLLASSLPDKSTNT